MTDRELLELAAKAAGKPGSYIEFYGECGINDDDPDGGFWNPLVDDGQALRLAVECDMTVCADGTSTVSACSGYGRDKVMVTQTVSECGGDKSAATRRAITRAAAEIGKQMVDKSADLQSSPVDKPQEMQRRT